MATIKKTDITHVGQAVEKLESSDTSTAGKGAAALEHPLASPQNNQLFFLTPASYLGVECLAGLCSGTPPQQTPGVLTQKSNS